jgi:hypothetical protein
MAVQRAVEVVGVAALDAPAGAFRQRALVNRWRADGAEG